MYLSRELSLIFGIEYDGKIANEGFVPPNPSRVIH